MGKQVGFFAEDVDLYNFLSFAEQAGFLALPDLIESDEEPEGVAPTKVKLTAELRAACFHVIPGGVSVAEAFYGEAGDNPHILRIMKHVSPVIEVRPGNRNGDRLSDGRIHFNMDSHVSHFEQGEKGYARLARYVRKWRRTKEYRFHVGPYTADDVTASRVKLVHWNEELSLA